MDAAGQLCYTDAYPRSVEARVMRSTTAARPRSSSSTGRSSTRAAAASLRTAASCCGRPMADLDRPRREKSGGDIVHELEPADGGRPEVGDVVSADLDWARRLTLMRTHTALHALCGVVWRDYGAQVTGGNMEPGAGRMDFEFERCRATSSTRSRRRSTTSWPRRARCASTSCRGTRRSRSRT